MARKLPPHPNRNFETPDKLKEQWDLFKENLKEQAKEWQKVQYVGKDGIKRTDDQKVPMTFEGFKRFCRESVGCVEQYFTNQDGDYKEFLGICRTIKEEIRENQIVGGMLGFYNPSITQRLNNLKETIDTTNHNVNLLNIDPLDDSTDNSP